MLFCSLLHFHYSGEPRFSCVSDTFPNVPVFLSVVEPAFRVRFLV